MAKLRIPAMTVAILVGRGAGSIPSVLAFCVDQRRCMVALKLRPVGAATSRIAAYRSVLSVVDTTVDSVQLGLRFAAGAGLQAGRTASDSDPADVV